ncbi:MAG: hypothetical protein ACD_23C00419G0001, partial [uncultured bacterium]
AATVADYCAAAYTEWLFSGDEFANEGDNGTFGGNLQEAATDTSGDTF